MFDPEAFEIAFTAVAPASDEPEDDEPIPLCALTEQSPGISNRSHRYGRDLIRRLMSSKIRSPAAAAAGDWMSRVRKP